MFMGEKVLGWPIGDFIPGMLREEPRDLLLFTVSGTRDDVNFCDACVLPRDFLCRTPRRVKEKDEQRICFVEGCVSVVDAKSRNDKRRPLCEMHKREFPVLCKDSTLVSFCFYCHRTHESRFFNINKNVCDERYLARKKKLFWKRLKIKQAKQMSTPPSTS